MGIDGNIETLQALMTDSSKGTMDVATMSTGPLDLVRIRLFHGAQGDPKTV